MPILMLRRTCALFLPVAACLLAPEAHAQQFNDAFFCRAAQEYAAKVNQDVGARVGAVTVNVGMAVLCATKVVDFKKRVLVSLNTFAAGWQGRKQQQWNSIYCEPGSIWRQAIDAGWTVSHTMTDADGTRHYMVATCR